MKEVDDNIVNKINAPVSEEKLKEECEKGYLAQDNELDQMWYSVNYEALCALQKSVIDDFNIKANIDGTEDENGKEINYDELTPEEIAAYEQKYRETHPTRTFTKEEESRLEMSFSEEEYSKRNANSGELQDDLRDKYFQHDTFEDSKKHFMNIGIISAKVNLEIGKQYKKWLEKMSEDDPQRKAKAMYLARTADSDSLYKSYGVSSLTKAIAWKHKQSAAFSSVMNDPEKLKTMTLNDFFDLTYMPKKYRELHLHNYQNNNKEINDKTSVYDTFRMIEEYKRNLKGDKTPVTDEDIQNSAMKDYGKFSFVFWAKAGTDSVRNNYSPEDRELMDIGETISSDFDFRFPKEIDDWIKNEAPGIIKGVKVDNLNKAYKNLKNEVAVKKTYNIQKTDPLANAFPRKSDSFLDSYISKHSGPLAVQAGENEKRIHLAKLMSASTYKRNGMNANVSAIHEFADELMKRSAFQKLTDKEVTKALYSSMDADRLQVKLYAKTFGVAPSKRENYIKEMKLLKEYMMPSKGRSNYYQDLYNAVAAIANMKPGDNNFYVANDRLVKAIRDYTKGKKNVRVGGDGKARFDNALDAMAILNKYVPGCRNFVDEQVNRIREVRKVQPGHKYYVDINNHGALKAKERHNTRQLEKIGGMKM
ncbi:hypothetical protein SAMN06297422_10111 [Lachnospiraceae bacterium]|nr:hypothetical protein SAMN06297422_10111 [Lachnospiraceae bacterium]